MDYPKLVKDGVLKVERDPNNDNEIIPFTNYPYDQEESYFGQYDNTKKQMIGIGRKIAIFEDNTVHLYEG